MVASVASQVLIIDKSRGENLAKIIEALSSSNIEVTVEDDLGTAIHRFQKGRFDTVVVDTRVEGMPIERTIQILKNIDPTTKIIVKTQENSKELETKIRNEAIYYYHLDSFGPDDLRQAIECAIIQQNWQAGAGKNADNYDNQDKLILLVDEDDRLVEVIKNNLMNHGFRVDICYDADEGIAQAKEKRPSALLVDINTPVGSTGLHFIEMIMNEKEFLTIPLMVFISKSKSEKYEKILARVKTVLPTWTYLEKPIKIEEVVPKLRALIA